MALLRCIHLGEFFNTSQLLRVFHRADTIGNISIGAFGPNGTNAMRFAAGDVAGIEARLLSPSGTTCIIGTRFRIAAHTTAYNLGWTVCLGDGSVAGPWQASVDINASGQFEANRGPSGPGEPDRAVLQTSSYVVPVNTWIDCWIKVVVHGSNGSIEVRVWEDGDESPTTAINISGVNTQALVGTGWDGVGIGDMTDGGTTDYAYAVIADASGTAFNDLPDEPLDVTTLRPNNRSAYALNQWVPSSGLSVVGMWDDDSAADDDTTYAGSSTQNHQQTTAVDRAPEATIYGCELFLCAKLTSGTPSVSAIGYQDGAANLGASVALGAAYTNVQQPYSALPDGSAFSLSAFNALQWGAKLTTTGAARITQMVVCVLHSRTLAEEEDAPNYEVTIGDETGLNPLLETFRIQETLDAPDTMICDIESASSPFMRFSLGDSVFVTEDGVRIFGGYVTGLRERGFSGPNGGDFVVEIQATSYELNAQRRIVTEQFSSSSPGEALVDVLTSLVDDYYGDVGVTLHPEQVDGPDVPALSFLRVRGDRVNADVADAVGFLWSIDFENRLRMWEPGDIQAPDNYDEAGNPEILTGDIQVEKQLQNGYANRVIIEGDPILVNDHNDQFTGDGVTDTFELTYRMVSHYGYLTIDGDPENLGTSPADWILDTSVIPNTIRRELGPPGNGDIVSILYNGLFVPEAQAEDAGEIAALGLYEYKEVVTSVPDNASAQEYADALLAQKIASKDEIVTMQTRELGFHPGQMMGIESDLRELTGDFLITQVDTASEPGGPKLLRTITAAKSLNNTHDWRKVIRQWSEAGEGTTAITASDDGGSGGGVGLHATTHESGGVDPINVEDLGASAGVEGDVLTRTAGGAEWQSFSGAGGGAPVDADYVVETANGTLSAESVLGTTVITTAAYASRQAAAKAGRLFLPNNGFHVERDTGSVWAPWGPIYPMTPPVDGDFSWVNQGGSTVDTTNGGIFLLAPATALTNLRVRVKTAPSPPYTITAALLVRSPGINFAGVGLCFRQSSDGKLATLGLEHNNDWQVVAHKFTSATAFSANYTSLNLGTLFSPMFLQISDNNTNRIVRISTDGQHWQQIHSVTRTDFLTANQVGFYASADQATWDCGVTLLSWKET